MSFLYWMTGPEFQSAKKVLKENGYSLGTTLLTPCQVLRAKGKKVIYAPPSVWSRLCVRQGSWYRDSAKAGKTMMMSEHKLPTELDSFLDAELNDSEFMPETLPTQNELQKVVDSTAYQKGKPEAWEKTTWWDAFMFKSFFGFFRFWKWNEGLKNYWLSQRSNHANFLSKKYTIKIENEDVPYSITPTKGVCSSCAEFFNVVSPESRKMVRSCPGSVVFGGAPNNTYVDVKVHKKG